VLAYLFWHRPRDGAATTTYERAHVAFHRSLAHAPPVGFLGSVALRVADLPWLRAAAAPEDRAGDEGLDSYEDWYFLEDHAALGVLNEAAIGRGHRTAHDDVARRSGPGAGGLYVLIEGHRPPPPAASSLAVWVAGPPRAGRYEIGKLLGDGIDPDHASLWRRQLVLGPAPEFCLLTPEPPLGVSPTRLPAGWQATALRRETLWAGS
jgi:hypothetical protein